MYRELIPPDVLEIHVVWSDQQFQEDALFGRRLPGRSRPDLGRRMLILFTSLLSNNLIENVFCPAEVQENLAPLQTRLANHVLIE